MRWYEYSAFYGLAVVCLHCVLQAGGCGPVVCSWAGGDVNAVCSMDVLRAGSYVPAVCSMGRRWSGCSVFYEYSTGWRLCASGVFYGLVIVCLRLFYGQAVVGL